MIGSTHRSMRIHTKCISRESKLQTATVGEKASREKRMHSCAETAADILLNDEGFTFSRG